MTDFPVQFIEIIENKLPSDSAAFFESIDKQVVTSIRLNLQHSQKVDLDLTDAVPWCDHGFFLKDRPSFSLDPQFHGGAYYVQESSSMFIDYVIKQIKKEMSGHLLVLDLCAAPGGKTTLLLDALEPHDVIVTNETIRARAQILKENVLKWGRSNCVVTHMDPNEFNKSKILYDIILVDAPCSGEGMFRKDKNAIAEWSVENVNLCASRQQRILQDILPCLKPGGFLIYSTCTFNDQENIENITLLGNKYSMQSIPFKLPEKWGIEEVIKSGFYGYHFYPNKVRGEGLFCSVLRKGQGENVKEIFHTNRSKLRSLEKGEVSLVSAFMKKESLANLLIHENGDVFHYSNETLKMMHTLANDYRLVYSGTKCGNINKKLFIPDHALALSDLITLEIPRLELTLPEALDFLRRSLTKVESETKSWTIACYNGTQLGWFKNLGNRINNYLPTEYRLRM